MARDPHDPRGSRAAVGAVRAVAAIRDLVAAAEPPVRLPLGSDSVSLVEGKLASVAKELDEWRELALSTDH